jgi:hypothetical protein
MPERCSPARPREKPGAPLPAARRSGPEISCDGGSGGNTIRDEIRFKEPDGLSARKKTSRLHKILDITELSFRIAGVKSSHPHSSALRPYAPS